MRTIKDSWLADEFKGREEDTYELDDSSKQKLALYTYQPESTFQLLFSEDELSAEMIWLFGLLDDGAKLKLLNKLRSTN